MTYKVRVAWDDRAAYLLKNCGWKQLKYEDPKSVEILYNEYAFDSKSKAKAFILGIKETAAYFSCDPYFKLVKS